MKQLLLILLIVSAITGSAQPVIPAISSSLTKKQIRNVTVLGELWGFLKYYHPRVAKGKWNWDSVLIQKIPLFIAAKTKDELNIIINDWLTEVGNVDSCKSCDNQVPDSLKYNLDLGWINKNNFTDATIQRISFIRDNRNQGYNYYVSYDKGFQITHEKPLAPYWYFQYPEAPYRLLLLFRYWNIINYFSPYKHLAGQDWQELLQQKIPAFYMAKDTLSYQLEYLKLVASLNDGHSVVFGGSSLFGFLGAQYWIPFECKYIEGNFIVSKIINDSLAAAIHIQVGDIIISVNGENARDRWARLAPYIPASGESDRELKFCMTYLFRGTNKQFTVLKIRQSQLLKDTFSLPVNSIPDKMKKQSWKIISDHIGYIDMDRLQKNEVDSMMTELKNTNGLIIDIRNYPHNTWPLIANYLCRQPFIMCRRTIPDWNYPGIFRYKEPEVYGKINDTPYAGKVVLLVDETSISHAEFSAMGLQASTKTITIGNYTAGADGDISNIFSLPGDFGARFSAAGVYYPDGTVTQRKGVRVDIIVRPTIKGLQEQRDEVLEKAVEFINKPDTK